MFHLKILNTREIKHILEKLEEQFGYKIDKEDIPYAFLQNKDNRIYIVTKDIAKIDLDTIRIDSTGMYFGELYKEHIRLSIEGAQIIARHATKGIIHINDEQMHFWIMGNDITWDEDLGHYFLIIAHHDERTGKDDILGCGKWKDGKIMNYVSKSRKLVVVNE
ncbi:MAG: hypothetical protein WC916_06790 [Candidatus Woesearchaeota archaeon]